MNTQIYHKLKICLKNYGRFNKAIEDKLFVGKTKDISFILLILHKYDI